MSAYPQDELDDIYDAEVLEGCNESRLLNLYEFIKSHPGMTLGELSETLRIDDEIMRDCLIGLEKEGFVKKVIIAHRQTYFPK